jgi:hypothetical protein
VHPRTSPQSQSTATHAPPGARMIRRLAVLSSVFTLVISFGLAGGATGASAKPAERGGSFTYKGLSYVWSEADYSDVQIRSTPQARDKLPAGVDPANIASAESHSRRTRTPPLEGMIAVLANYCTWSPESYFGANFRSACAAHDRCYRSTSTTSRLACDQRFHAGLIAACLVTFRASNPLRYGCAVVSQDYYYAVRIFGKSSYHGRGNRA